MKKAILAALTFIVVGFLLVNGTFALPDINEVFQTIADMVNGAPEPGGAGTAVHVSLLSDNTPQQLYPGGAASRATRVRNEGSGSVYFRLVYALQYDADSWDKLTITFAADEDFVESGWLPISIGTTDYRMKVFTYTEALAAQAESPAVTLTIAMSTAITSEEISRYRSDFLQTQVLAIDPAPFTNKGYTTAEGALDLALPISATFNPF